MALRSSAVDGSIHNRDSIQGYGPLPAQGSLTSCSPEGAPCYGHKPNLTLHVPLNLIHFAEQRREDITTQAIGRD